jgi:hypothetical protein
MTWRDNTDRYNMSLLKTHDNGVRESKPWGHGRLPGRKASFDLTYTALRAPIEVES